MAFPTAVNDEQTNPVPDPGTAIESEATKAGEIAQEAVFAQQQRNMIYETENKMGVKVVTSIQTELTPIGTLAILEELTTPSEIEDKIKTEQDSYEK